MKLINKAYALVILILLQALIVTSIVNGQILEKMGRYVGFQYYFLSGIFVNLIAIISIILIYAIIKFLREQQKSIVKLNNSREVINALKAQRHDFLNHLAVIDGLVQLGKVDRCKEYVKEICGNVEQGFAISGIRNIEVQALLYRKCAIAENMGIKVNLDIRSDLDRLTIKSIDLCKVIFNLLDNAIYELQHCDQQTKILTIGVYDDDKNYEVRIINSSPVLPSHLYTKIFEEGYTTKGGDGHGFGLHIVNRIVKKNKCSIRVDSSEQMGTRFTLYIPMNKSIEEQEIEALM